MSVRNVCLRLSHSRFLQASIVGLLILASVPLGGAGECPDDPSRCGVHAIVVVSLATDGTTEFQHTYIVSPVGQTVTVTVQWSAVLTDPGRMINVQFND